MDAETPSVEVYQSSSEKTDDDVYVVVSREDPLLVAYKCIWMQKRLLSRCIRVALKKLMIHFQTKINDIKETFYHFSSFH